MNILKGKSIFYKCNGSIVAIDREFGDEYSRCQIPPNVEEAWRADIICSLRDKIEKSIGADKVGYVFDYVQIIDKEQAVNFIIGILKDNYLDTFTCLLLCEELKRYLKFVDIKEKNEISSTLAMCKNKMLKTKITIDDSYKSKRYMSDYDFSEKNLKLRIESL